MRGRRRSGLSAVLVVLILMVLVAFASLAVDFGRVWLARAEMQTVADAAATSGALALPISQAEVEAYATETASRNPVIDTEKVDAQHLGERTNPGVILEPDEDLAVGIWDPAERSFTELTDDASTPNFDERRMANAVLAVGKRNAARDSALPLILAPVLGAFESDIERPATAYITGGPTRNHAFIGLDWVRAEGNTATIDGPDGRTSTANGGGVASNGDIDLTNADVYGDVRPGIDQDIIAKPNTVISGWAADLDQPLVYPADTFPAMGTNTPANGITPPGHYDANTQNFEAKGTAKVSIKAGTYYFRKCTLGGQSEVTVSGPATIYVKGDFTMTGNALLTIDGSKGPVNLYVDGNFDQSGGNIISTGLASNLYISVTKANTSLKISGNTATAAHIYAPVSNVTVNGTPEFTGWIVGKTLRFLGTSNLHYDGSGIDKTTYAIQLVK